MACTSSAPGAARRDRHHLREPAQRDRRCRRACLKSGNVAILRGGSECCALERRHPCGLAEGLRAAGLPEAAIQRVKTTDRAAVGLMLAGLNGDIDVIVPRGGKGLIGRVQREARVPVMAHLEGLLPCLRRWRADLEMARSDRR